MKKIFLLLLLLLSSCSKNIGYFINTNNKVVLRPSVIEIKERKVVSWKVGPRRKQRVSKGIFVRFELPMFINGDLKDLVFRRGVDSWLVRLRKKTLATSKVIDRMFLPFVQQGSLDNDGKLYVSQQRSLTYNIVYKAASKLRWEKRACPPLKHVYEITDTEIKRAPTSEVLLELNKISKKNYINRVEPYGFKSRKVDAGIFMSGQYMLEIAMYNSVKKERKSKYFTASDILYVNKEIRKTIIGCENYQYKEKLDNSDVINKFEFGK